MFAWVNVPSLGNRWQGIVAKSRDDRTLVRNLGKSRQRMGIRFICLEYPRQSGYQRLAFCLARTGRKSQCALSLCRRCQGGGGGSSPRQRPRGSLLLAGKTSSQTNTFRELWTEISISNAARSGSWISAQYSSTQDQFVTYSTDPSATGSGGGTASGTASVLVQPQTTTWNFTSVPSGLEVVVYGRSQTTPFSLQMIVNGVSTISATSPQTVGNTQYSFSSWSDGGAQTHLITAAPRRRLTQPHFPPPAPPLAPPAAPSSKQFGIPMTW